MYVCINPSHTLFVISTYMELSPKPQYETVFWQLFFLSTNQISLSVVFKIIHGVMQKYRKGQTKQMTTGWMRNSSSGIFPEEDYIHV